MDNSTIDSIEDLIDLALKSGSASTKGRHAAFHACKLIVDNGVFLTASAPKGVCRHCKGSTDPSDQAFTLLNQNIRDITMRWEGTCLSCKKVIEVGDRAHWKKETGVTHHGECANFWFT